VATLIAVALTPGSLRSAVFTRVEIMRHLYASDFVAVTLKYTFHKPGKGYKAGSTWEQTLVFVPGKRYYFSAERTFKVPDMYAGIFTLAMFGYALNRLFLFGEARLIRWHQESSGRR